MLGQVPSLALAILVISRPQYFPPRSLPVSPRLLLALALAVGPRAAGEALAVVEEVAVVEQANNFVELRCQ